MAETLDQLSLDAGGRWILTNESGTRYLIDLDEMLLVRVTPDKSHTHPDGTHPLRRDGEPLVLLDVVDLPIQVGRPLGWRYEHATRGTIRVIEIRRLT